MRLYIKIFLRIIVAYHVLHTVFLRWMGVGDAVLLSSLKEILRFGFVMILLLLNPKQTWAFIRNWIWLVIGLIVLTIRALLLSHYQGVNVMTMVVGVKYDLIPLFIVVSAMFVGTLLSTSTGARRVKDLWQMLLFVLLGGLIRQIAKIFLPDLISSLGYGPVGDYTLASAPPLYYRTGPGWWMRLQWLFSWPNNYGFLLVAYFSVIVSLFFTKNKERNLSSLQNILIGILFIGSIIRTLSRGVIVGAVLQCLILLWLYKPQWKRYIGWLIWAWVLCVVVLSVLKRDSTVQHFTAWTEGWSAFVEKPLGHWLGSAWPAIHRAGVYLPENHYLQLLLDLGLPGFLLRIRVIVWVIVCGRQKNIAQSSHEEQVRWLLIIWLLWLLAEGLFLHVFEDSMVNYLFLIPLWIFLGMQKMNQNNRA